MVAVALSDPAAADSHLKGKGRPVTSIWAGGDGLWSEARNWIGGPPMLNEQSSVFIDDGNMASSTVLLDIDATIAHLSIDWGDSVSIVNGLSLTVGPNEPGEINLAGDLIINGTGLLTNLQVGCGGTLELFGDGVVTLNESFHSRIIGTVGGGCAPSWLVNHTTIQGAGIIGAGTLRLENHGVIEANKALELITITPMLGANGVINDGILMASEGGNLRLTNGEFNNEGGTIRADAFSHVDLIGATIVGGTLETLGNGVIRSHAVGATLTNATLNGRLELGVVRLTLGGQFTNNGVVDLVSNNSLDGVVEFVEIVLPPGSGDVTLKGGGEFNMIWGEFHSGSTAQGGRLIHHAGHTIKGAGYIGNNTLGVTNAGTIIANSSLPLVIDPINSQIMVNSGTLRSSGTGGLLMTGGTFRNDGVIEVLPSGRCVFSGLASIANVSGSALVGGTWKVVAGNSTATVFTSAPSLFFNAADVTLSGPNASFPLIQSLANNSGRFTLDDRRQFVAANTFFMNDGYLAVKNGSKFTVNGSFTQSSAAETHIHLNAVNVVPGWVALKTNGSAWLGGTLRITADANVNMLAGQSIPLISATSYVGGFQNIITPAGIAVTYQGGVFNAVVTGCPADLNGNGTIGADDVLIVIQQWGDCPVGGACIADLNHDGVVNSADVTVLMGFWGPCF